MTQVLDRIALLPEEFLQAPSVRVELDLRARIEGGKFPPGSMLPGRKNLAAEYGVALKTLERAIGRLLKDGTLTADSRRGTFVAPAAMGSVFERRVSASELAGVSIGIITHVHIEPDAPDCPTGLLERWKTIHSFERVLAERGVRTHFINQFRGMEIPPIPLREAIDSLFAAGAKGAAIINNRGSFEEIRQLPPRDDFPLIFVGGDPDTLPIGHVCWNDREMGYRAALHLLRNDCGELLFLSAFPAEWAERRILGAARAVREAELAAGSFKVCRGEEDVIAQKLDQEDAGDRLARQAIKAGQWRAGVIAANDAIALGAMRAAEGAGLRVGTDYLIVGFGDTHASRIHGLTSFRRPDDLLGEEGARMILTGLTNPAGRTEMQVKAHLVPRRSTSWRRDG